MPDAVFKDLCIDACHPDLVGPFWAGVLGLTAERDETGDYKLSGSRPEQTVWVNTVPEPQQGKSRVHLDVRFPEGRLPDATLLRARDEEIHWTVMADPDGVELCVFGPRDDAPMGLVEICVDAADPRAIATWWAERTGASLHQDEGKPWVWLEEVPGLPCDYWVFNRVPEPKTVKNRVHWDVTGEVDVLVAAGARVLAVLPSWTVLADPEGNEFCCFAP